MSEFLPPATPEVRELFEETAVEMTELFGISRAEAVARINAQWEGREFLGENEVILHEDPYYWALFIYYRDVKDWSPDADRSHWTPLPPPPADSPAWTLPPGQPGRPIEH